MGIQFNCWGIQAPWVECCTNVDFARGKAEVIHPLLVGSFRLLLGKALIGCCELVGPFRLTTVCVRLLRGIGRATGEKCHGRPACRNLGAEKSKESFGVFRWHRWVMTRKSRIQHHSGDGVRGHAASYFGSWSRGEIENVVKSACLVDHSASAVMRQRLCQAFFLSQEIIVVFGVAVPSPALVVGEDDSSWVKRRVVEVDCP